MSDQIRKNSVEDYVQRFRPGVNALLPYLDWLDKNAENRVTRDYNNQMDRTMTFPVYDGTLLAFIKEAQKTGLIDRNYSYVYSRNGLKTAIDELRFIEKATLTDLDDLAGILSKYVLGGMTRGQTWTEAVQDRIFYEVIKKMDDLLNLWNHEATARR